jgi:hypothetical protein
MEEQERRTILVQNENKQPTKRRKRVCGERDNVVCVCVCVCVDCREESTDESNSILFYATRGCIHLNTDPQYPRDAWEPLVAQGFARCSNSGSGRAHGIKASRERTTTH